MQLGQFGHLCCGGLVVGSGLIPADTLEIGLFVRGITYWEHVLMSVDLRCISGDRRHKLPSRAKQAPVTVSIRPNTTSSK